MLKNWWSNWGDTILVVLFSVMIFVIPLGAILVSIEDGKERGIKLGVKQMQAEAIEHGFAHYDPKTGEWQWNKEKPQ